MLTNTSNKNPLEQAIAARHVKDLSSTSTPGQKPFHLPFHLPKLSQTASYRFFFLHKQEQVQTTRTNHRQQKRIHRKQFSPVRRRNFVQQFDAIVVACHILIGKKMQTLYDEWQNFGWVFSAMKSSFESNPTWTKIAQRHQSYHLAAHRVEPRCESLCR